MGSGSSACPLSPSAQEAEAGATFEFQNTQGYTEKKERWEGKKGWSKRQEQSGIGQAVLCASKCFTLSYKTRTLARRGSACL